VRLSKQEIRRRIYTSGVKVRGYQVHHDMEGEAIVCHVPSVSIAQTIVKALRDRAMEEHANGNG
jgi:alpha-acetolactate decarboxylase